MSLLTRLPGWWGRDAQDYWAASERWRCNISKGLQLVLQLLVFEIKRSKFYVMSEELLDEFFLSAFHGSLLPVSKHWKLLPYRAGGGKAVPT